MTDGSPKRASRRARVPKRGARLRDRDVEVLLAVAKMRLVRTTELTRLFFSAKGTCQKRLRKLYDAGLLRVVVTDLASENRYAITRLGHTFLENAIEPGDVPTFRPPPRVDGRAVLHLDLLNAYRVGLATGAEQHGVKLVRFRPDWELRAEDPRAPLVPDALASLKTTGRELGLAVEVDVCTEALHIIRHKLVRYAEIHANRTTLFGMKIDVLLFVVATQRRARSIAKLLFGMSPARTTLLGVPPIAVQTGGLVSGLWTAEGLGDGSSAEAGEGLLPAQCRIR